MNCTVNYFGIEWTVDGKYRKGKPARFYLPNGDPGYPSEPDEIDSLTITIKQDNCESDNMVAALHQDAIEDITSRAMEIFAEYDPRDDDLEAGVPY